MLFNIPSNLTKYNNSYDGGNYGNPPAPVKHFINNPKNLKDNSPLKNYCKSVNGDMSINTFTTYCYDYNDISSSPVLKKPYKLSITYSDLD